MEEARHILPHFAFAITQILELGTLYLGSTVLHPLQQDKAALGLENWWRESFSFSRLNMAISALDVKFFGQNY